MEIKIDEKMKLVEVWLTQGDQLDPAIQHQLNNLYQHYRDKKYMVAQFHSGTQGVYDLTRDLLIYNKKRIPQLAMEQEKRQADLTGSQKAAHPIQ